MDLTTVLILLGGGAFTMFLGLYFLYDLKKRERMDKGEDK